jgi:phosphatidylglycerophosphatase A
MLRADDPPRHLLLSPSVFLGSMFLVGFAPAMRGTCGSMLAGFFAVGLWMAGAGTVAWWIGAVVFSALSWAIGAAALKVTQGRKDPGWFVLDEAAGLFLTLALIPAKTLLEIVAAFLAFRLYDILKPWPVRSFERIPGSLGILADDLAAAVLAAWTILAGAAILAT